MKIYGDTQSGNCYKIKLLLTLLQHPHEWEHIDILNGDTHTSKFLQLNPNGKIPVLELNNGHVVSESNAILFYLAKGTPFLPDDTLIQAKILQWQFFEQYSHEPYIAVARFIAKYLGLPEEKRELYQSKQEGGHKALQVMEQQLRETPFIVGNNPTIADISLYGYTHVAEEGGFDLSGYPSTIDWLNKIQSLPHYIGMK